MIKFFSRTAFFLLVLLPVSLYSQEYGHKKTCEPNEVRKKMMIEKYHPSTKDLHQKIHSNNRIFPFKKITLLAKKLEITEQQLKEIEKIHFQLKEKQIDYEAKIKKINLELEKEMCNEILIKENILKIHETKMKILNESNLEKVKISFQAYDVLTEDQKKKIAEIRKFYK